MKMIFFSAERAEVELVRKELMKAAIPCELHENDGAEGMVAIGYETELWLQHDEDANRAIMLCVQLGIGFAKRAQEEKNMAA